MWHPILLLWPCLRQHPLLILNVYATLCSMLHSFNKQRFTFPFGNSTLPILLLILGSTTAAVEIATTTSTTVVSHSMFFSIFVFFYIFFRTFCHLFSASFSSSLTLFFISLFPFTFLFHFIIPFGNLSWFFISYFISIFILSLFSFIPRLYIYFGLPHPPLLCSTFFYIVLPSVFIIIIPFP